MYAIRSYYAPGNAAVVVLHEEGCEAVGPGGSATGTEGRRIQGSGEGEPIAESDRQSQIEPVDSGVITSYSIHYTKLYDGIPGGDGNRMGAP